MTSAVSATELTFAGLLLATELIDCILKLLHALVLERGNGSALAAVLTRQCRLTFALTACLSWFARKRNVAQLGNEGFSARSTRPQRLHCREIRGDGPTGDICVTRKVHGRRRCNLGTAACQIRGIDEALPV